MKFKVGDRVTIVSNREMEDFQYSDKWPGVALNMYDYCGRTAIIVSIHGDFKNGSYFHIDIDNGDYIWTGDLAKRNFARLG